MPRIRKFCFKLREPSRDSREFHPQAIPMVDLTAAFLSRFESDQRNSSEFGNCLCSLTSETVWVETPTESQVPRDEAEAEGTLCCGSGCWPFSRKLIPASNFRASSLKQRPISLGSAWTAALDLRLSAEGAASLSPAPEGLGFEEMK